MNYQDYKRLLAVNKHKLDDALEQHASMQSDISDEVSRQGARVNEAKDVLARIEAQLMDKFKEADAKLSLDIIKGKVLREFSRLKAWDDLQEARQDHERWEGLYEAWKTRGYNIKSLGDLFSANYYAVTSVVGTLSIDRIDHKARAAMRGDRAAERAEQSARDAGATTRRRRLSDD